MEEFLHNMKTLRSQMNDVEEQAAKISVEEQMQITTLQTLRKDLDLAKSETRQLQEDTELMVKAKGQICSRILEKQRKIAALESDSSTFSQTLALIQQEKVSLSAKLVEKGAYYTKVAEEINTKLQEQQEWINSYKHSSKMGQHCLVKDNFNEQPGEMGTAEFHGDLEKNLMENLDAAKAKFDSVTEMKFKLVSENSKVKQSIELMKSRINNYKPELKEIDRKSLEEEIQALLSDKAGETEYLQSLQTQIQALKGISHMVKCDCGEEYKIELARA